MRLLVLSPPPPGLAAALGALADAGQATILFDAPADRDKRDPSVTWDAVLAVDPTSSRTGGSSSGPPRAIAGATV